MCPPEGSKGKSAYCRVLGLSRGKGRSGGTGYVHVNQPDAVCRLVLSPLPLQLGHGEPVTSLDSFEPQLLLHKIMYG